MFKKLCIPCLISLISLFSVVTNLCLANAASELNQARDNVCSLIEAGKLNEAKLANDKLLADFNDEPNLPEVWHLIAVQYERFNNFEEAKSNFQQIIDRHPDSPFANKARLGKSRADTISLVMLQKFSEAKAAVDRMSSDFTGNPDLPETQYWVAERFERNGKFEDVNLILTRLIRDYPENPWAEKAKLNVSRAEAMAFIMKEKYQQAQDVLDKMAVDFTGKAALPGALYWTTERFERSNKFEEAKSNYQRIIQNYPDSTYAERARLGIARAEVMSLIMSQNYEQAGATLAQMMSNFAGNPGLPGTLYWLTEKYEWADKYDEAKGVYQQIIQQFPDSIYADRARLGIRRVDVMALMESADGSRAESALNQMITDFRDNPELPRAVLIIGAKCFLGAKTPDYARRAAKILENVLYALPKTEAMAGMYADVYCSAGDAYFTSGEYTKATSCYQKLVSEFPEYTLSYHAQFRLGEIAEKLGESGQISILEAQSRRRLAYEELLNKYPDCKYAAFVQIWLVRN